jgi:hypothetical protein
MQTVSPGVEQRVDAPPLLPPTSGLLQVAKVIEHAVQDDNPFQPTEDHWLAGIRWTVPNNQPGAVFQACNPATSLSRTASGSPAGAYYPFAAVAEDTCDAVSFSEQTFRDRALESLTAREPGLAESQLERSTLAGNPKLADNETGHVFLGSTGNTQATQLALTPKDALAVLDEGIAFWGAGQGMIHAPSYVIAQWVASRAVVIDDLTDTTIPRDPKRVFFSPNGNIIVPGSGYRGVSPDGAVVPDLTVGNHAAMWCYATDLIVVHRDDRPSFLPDTMAQALDRQTNTVTWRAFRAYAFAWNRLLHASVKVNTALVAAP